METEYNFTQGKRGAIEQTPIGKTQITIRLADGGNYQSLINDALREYIQQHCKS